MLVWNSNSEMFLTIFVEEKHKFKLNKSIGWISGCVFSFIICQNLSVYSHNYVSLPPWRWFVRLYYCTFPRPKAREAANRPVVYSMDWQVHLIIWPKECPKVSQVARSKVWAEVWWDHFDFSRRDNSKKNYFDFGRLDKINPYSRFIQVLWKCEDSFNQWKNQAN